MKKTTNRLLSLLLALAMAFSLSVSAGAADTATVSKGDIVVLYTNDVHCAVDDNIGYAGLAAYQAEMKKATDYVTLVDDGDAIQGAAIGTLSKGSYLIDIMNQVGYSVAVPGNHEFDYGMKNFLALAKDLNCGYVCCNFIDLKTGKPVFDSYKMMTYGDTKVAYVGIDTPESISKSTPAYFQDGNGNYIYGFCSGNNGQDLYQAVQTAVDAAKAAGATYVIAVGHCGIDEQSAPWRSTDIIAKVSGLSAFIDGHSHSTIPSQKVAGKDGKTVLLTSTGTKLAAIGKLVLKPGGAVTTELVTGYTQKDATTDAFVKSIQAKYADLLNKVVAKSSVQLTVNDANGVRAVRSAETNLGDLCADAYRAISGADIAFVNGGGIRDNIAAGDITYGDIIAVHPFGNALCVVEATGQEILDALEMAARACPAENGGFLQVSGLTYTIDTTIPSSVKVDDNKMFVSVDGPYRVKNVEVGGTVIHLGGTTITTGSEPLDLKKTYTLASHNYMLKSGGDGINMFMDNKLLQNEVMLDNQVLITYITDKLNGTVPSAYASSQGRIRIVYTPFTDISDSAWYFDGVKYAYQNNLFSGTTATAFAPAAFMTRGQLVTVLWRMAGKPAASAASVFKDVAANSAYASAIAWAAENGITGGYTATTFAPGRAVTREQLATILKNYADFKGYDTTAGGMAIREYGDYDSISAFALPSLAWANAAGLIQGYSATGTIAPQGKAQRSQVAVILQRFCTTVATTSVS